MSNNIYDDFKERLKQSIDNTRIDTIVRNNSYRKDFVFCMADSQDELYTSVMSAIERQSCFETERLLAELCNRYSLEYKLQSDSNQYRYDMEIKKGNKVWKVEIKTSPRAMNSGAIKAMSSDVCIVYLLKQTPSSYALLEKTKRYYPEMETYVIADFIKELFGYKEEKSFNKAFANFSQEMKQYIGYDVCEICNEKNLGIMREELKSELKGFDFDGLYRDCLIKEKEVFLYDEDFDSILNKFGENNKVLFGSSDFAISFLTSEWLYKHYLPQGKLDNTYVVSGYLKSVEQLLWEIIQLKGVGCDFGGYDSEKHRNKVVGDSNIETQNTTLEPLALFIKNNWEILSSLFVGNKGFIANYMYARLSEWRKRCRNGYFHKDNIDSIKEIKRIRNETLFIYCLVLGTVDLTEDDYNSLMGRMEAKR